MFDFVITTAGFIAAVSVCTFCAFESTYQPTQHPVNGLHAVGLAWGIGFSKRDPYVGAFASFVASVMAYSAAASYAEGMSLTEDHVRAVYQGSTLPFPQTVRDTFVGYTDGFSYRFRYAVCLSCALLFMTSCFARAYTIALSRKRLEPQIRPSPTFLRVAHVVGVAVCCLDVASSLYGAPVWIVTDSASILSFAAVGVSCSSSNKVLILGVGVLAVTLSAWATMRTARETFECGATWLSPKSYRRVFLTNAFQGYRYRLAPSVKSGVYPSADVGFEYFSLLRHGLDLCLLVTVSSIVGYTSTAKDL